MKITSFMSILSKCKKGRKKTDVQRVTDISIKIHSAKLCKQKQHEIIPYTL